MTVISDFHELLKLKEEMQNEVYHDLFKEFDQDERYYNLDIRELLNLPDKFIQDAVVLPTTREVIEAAVNHVNPVFRRITVPRRVTTPNGTAQAQHLKKFYAAFLNWIEHQPATSPFRDGVKHLSVYGKANFKLLWDIAKRPGKPKREQFGDDEEFEDVLADWQATASENLPFTLIVPHPKSIMEDPWHDPHDWVIETSEMQVGKVLALYPHWANGRGRRLSDIVDVIEYWDNKVRSVVADSEPALKTRDGSGIVRHKWRVDPYIIGASGLGYDDSEHNPAKRYVGMLRHIRDIIKSESRSFSIADIVLKAGTWPRWVAEGVRANEMPAMKIDDYGTMTPIPEGVTLRKLEMDLPPDALMGHMALTNGIISSATAPRVVRGLSQTGMRSGFDRQLAMGEARLQYDPIARAMEKMLTELCHKAGMLVEFMGEGPLSIAPGADEDEFMSVSPALFKGHHSVKVEVNVLEPEDEIRRNQDAAGMVAAGLWSPDTAIRKRFPDLDPKTELGKILAFRLLFSEPMLNLLGAAANQTVAGNLGLNEVLEMVMGQIQEASGNISARQRDTDRQNREPRAEQGEGSRSEQAGMRAMNLQEGSR